MKTRGVDPHGLRDRRRQEPPSPGRGVSRLPASVVFHAAAYKHVPLMEETNAWEAVQNNSLGTWRARTGRHRTWRREVRARLHRQGGQSDQRDGREQAARRNALPRAAQRANTQFVAVRFGNVLGSTGSVIPKFHKQIAEGGPVTVTHPEIRRYLHVDSRSRAARPASRLDGPRRGDVRARHGRAGKDRRPRA